MKIIVDIDGTIADIGHRLHYLEDKDWDSFFDACVDDEPIKDVLEVISGFAIKHEIIFCTGRSDRVRRETTEWLYKHCDPHISFDLLMRKDGDHRPDTLVKPELIKDIPKEDILVILEDRSSVVRMWRKLGYRCFQVANGDF